MLQVQRTSQGAQDLKVINTYLQSPLEPKLQPRNLHELAHIVRNRLTKSPSTREQTSLCHSWLKEKGMNVQPLIDYLKYKGTKAPSAVKQRQIDCPEQPKKNSEIKPILFNHQQQITNTLDYVSATLLSSIPNRRQVRKRQFKTAMNNIGCFIKDTNEYRQRMPSSPNPRDKHKRHKYISAVQRILDIEVKMKNDFQDASRISAEQIAKLFLENVGVKIFRILYKQFREVDFTQQKDSVMTKLLIQSLSIVEQELSQELPLNYQAMTYYLHQKYLQNISRNDEYVFDSQHGSLWGKIFLYFRAGKINNAVGLLQNLKEHELINDIKANFMSIKDGLPAKVRIDGHLHRGQKDVFKEQILYAIGGQMKYSCDALANPQSLDCVWILLRNTGIYYLTDGKIYQKIQTQMTAYYQNQNHPEALYYSAYLLDFQALAKSQESQGLDRDDLMHLLILLNRVPLLSKDIIRYRLTEYAVSYALELIQEGRKEYTNYILMIPRQEIVQAGSSLLATPNIFNQVEWSTFLKYLPEDYFRALLIATTQKYVISTGNYLDTATTILDLIHDRQEALEMLIQMLILHLQQRRHYEYDQISKAIRLFSSWLSEEVDDVYFRLYELFQTSVKLSQSLLNRNYSKVGDIVDSKPLICCENVDYGTSKMLQKLVEKKGVEVFFMYLCSLKRGADIVLGELGKKYEVQSYKNDIYKTAKSIESHHKFREACNQKIVDELIQQLRESLLEEKVLEFHNQL